MDSSRTSLPLAVHSWAALIACGQRFLIEVDETGFMVEQAFTVAADDRIVVATHRGDQIDVFAGNTPQLLIFIPAAFTPTCTREVCELDELATHANRMGVQVLVASCDAPATLAHWFKTLRISSSIVGLSDHWPHGRLASYFGAFDETYGIAKRQSWAIRTSGECRLVAQVASGDQRELSDHLRGMRWASVA